MSIEQLDTSMLPVQELQKLRNTYDEWQKTETNPELQTALKVRMAELRQREALQTCPICRYLTHELGQSTEHNDTHQKYLK